jgi:hypothetical protein
VDALHRHACGIPRVTNLLAEHALINAFVDQQKPISAEIVDAVAHDTEFCEPTPVAPPAAVIPAAPANNGNGANAALVDTLLQALHALTERAARGEHNEKS